MTPDKRVEEIVGKFVAQFDGRWPGKLTYHSLNWGMQSEAKSEIIGWLRHTLDTALTQYRQDLMSEVEEERAVETEIHYDMYGLELAKAIAQTSREAQTIIKSLTRK